MSSLPLTDPGVMLAIAAGPKDIQPLLAPFGSSLVLSNYNSPRQTVVAGSAESARRFREACAARNIPCRQLPVSHAFHSDIVAPAAAAFHSALEAIRFEKLTGRVISTASADDIAAEADLKPLLAQ
jgi:enediyne polyketide synthase